MKAYLIDPWEMTTREVEYNGDYRQIYEHIEAQPFDMAIIDHNTRDAVFVDDEGLLRSGPQAFFMIRHCTQPLAGKGLVLGCDDEGESIEPQISLEELRESVLFLGVKEVK